MFLLKKTVLSILIVFLIQLYPVAAQEKQADIEENDPAILELNIEKQEVPTDKQDITIYESEKELTKFQKFKLFIKGKRARDTLYGGMWSKHFSSNNYREAHNLGALQYKGYYAGTFTNSHSDQVYTIGIARTVAEKKFGKHLIIDAGYKIGPMYGYKRGVPHIARFSILPLACLGFTYRHIGIDLNIFPASAISFSTRLNLDIFRAIIPSKDKIEETEEL